MPVVGVKDMKQFAAAALMTAIVAASLGSCSGDEDPTDDTPGVPTAREVACPADVEAAVLTAHSCSSVATTGGVTILVLQVDAPEETDANPVLVTGTNLGNAPDYGGQAPIAERTSRATLIVDLPGTAHATPLLDCPEVNALAGPAASDPDGARRGVVAAVSDCRDRLLAAGTDAADFSVSTAAAVLHDVVVALDIEQVVALSTGTTGTVAVEWARQHPEDLEAMVLDTPVFTNPPLRQHTEDLIAGIAADCASDRNCSRSYGDIAASWNVALRAARTAPITIRTGATPVVLDQTQLRRAVLWVGGGGDKGAAVMPALVAEAASGRAGDLLDEYAADQLANPPYCVGYLPKCDAEDLTFGAGLSYNCPTLLDDPLWTDICHAWGVTSGPNTSNDVVDVPTLVLTGRYDGFATTAAVEAVFADVIPGAFFVEDPAGAHNALALDCIREIRTAWLAGDVHQPPAPHPCLVNRSPDFY